MTILRVKPMIGVVGALLALACTARAATVTVTPSVAAFSTVKVDGRFTLMITAAPRETVKLAGDHYLIENLAIGVAGGTLTIARPHGLDLPKNESVTITITAPALRRIALRGRVHASIAGLTGQAFTLTNNGAAAATLAGTVGRFHLISRGFCSIDAGALHAGTAILKVRGQGNLRIFADQAAYVTMYGEGRIDVLGHPAVHQFKTLAYGIVSLK